jgi:Protein of unknown function (DUF3426)
MPNLCMDAHIRTRAATMASAARAAWFNSSMFINCPYCRTLVATDPATDLPPPHCPQCGGPLREGLRARAADNDATSASVKLRTVSDAQDDARGMHASDDDPISMNDAVSDDLLLDGIFSDSGMADHTGELAQGTIEHHAVADAETGFDDAGHASTSFNTTASNDTPSNSAASNDAASNDAALNGAASDSAGSERGAVEHAAVEQAVVERAATEHAAVERAATEHAAVEYIATEDASVGTVTLPPAPAHARVGARGTARTPSFVRERKTRTGVRVWPSVAAVAALALLLMLQTLLADRARLSADARWRPLLQTLCAALSCDLPPWREPGAFTLLQRDVRQHPNRSGALRVSATFRNDARWPQPWPRLHLTLSDSNGRIAGERSFEAREYLGGTPEQAELGSGESATVAMDILEPAPQIVAYDFKFR